jgi:hypothetical protein
LDDLGSDGGSFAFELPEALKKQFLQPSHDLQSVEQYLEEPLHREAQQDSQGSLTIDTLPILPKWNFTWEAP